MYILLSDFKFTPYCLNYLSPSIDLFMVYRYNHFEILGDKNKLKFYYFLDHIFGLI